MKKSLVIKLLLCSFVVALGLSGCKKDKDNVDATDSQNTRQVETDTISDEKNGNAKEIVDDTELKSDNKKNIAPAATYNKAYQKFLNNECEASFDLMKEEDRTEGTSWEYNSMGDYFSEGTGYNLSSILEGLYNSAKDNYDERLLPNDIEYSFIDCGNDGIPELALRLNCIGAISGETKLFVFKLIDEKIQCLYFNSWGYRSFGEINEYGYIITGGASGAAVYDNFSYFIDSEDKVKTCLIEEDVFSTWFLYIPDNEELGEYAEELGIVDNMYITRYSFKNIDADDYKNYLLNDCMYTFEPITENGNPLPEKELEAAYKEDSPYMTFWNKTGLKLYSREEIDKLISDHYKEIGLDESVKDCEPIDNWLSISQNKIDSLINWQVEPETLVLESPSWEYYCNSDEEITTKTKLKQISSKPNDVIDDYKWFEMLGITEPNRLEFSDDTYTYRLSGLSNEGYEWYPYLMDIINYNGDVEYKLDFSEYYLPDSFDNSSRSFVEESIHWAEARDGILYVSTYHMTYAESARHNGYITAFDMNDDFKVLWRTEPLTCNSDNFIITDDAIICGYGFTAEPDYVYVLDKNTGARTETYKVKTGPDWFYLQDNNLYVRCYDTDYVFALEE